MPNYYIAGATDGIIMLGRRTKKCQMIWFQSMSGDAATFHHVMPLYRFWVQDHELTTSYWCKQ